MRRHPVLLQHLSMSFILLSSRVIFLHGFLTNHPYIIARSMITSLLSFACIDYIFEECTVVIYALHADLQIGFQLKISCLLHSPFPPYFQQPLRETFQNCFRDVPVHRVYCGNERQENRAKYRQVTSNSVVVVVVLEVFFYCISVYANILFILHEQAQQVI